MTKYSANVLAEIQNNLNVCDWECETERKYREKICSPLTAIRAHCVICMGGQVGEVGKCSKANCALYPFRMGKNPFHGNVAK